MSVKIAVASLLGRVFGALLVVTFFGGLIAAAYGSIGIVLKLWVDVDTSWGVLSIIATSGFVSLGISGLVSSLVLEKLKSLEYKKRWLQEETP